jgi:DNA processing protein
MPTSAAVWSHIARTPGFHATQFRAWVALHESLDAALASLADPRHARLDEAGVSRKVLESLVASQLQPDACGSNWLERAGHHVIPATSPLYPPLLLECPGAPPVLFVRGDPVCLQRPQLAMVGSRNPTAGGRDTARAFAEHLSRCGLLITSGLALGIDAACHEGAMAAEGQTIAVCAHGLDTVYPPTHATLAARIASQGALISEFAPGTPARRAHFPQRNRLIASLSLGTLVVEAARESGSLITARFAGEAGREVFAIPGSIHNPLAKGCHALIRQGAKLVEEAADILSEISFSHIEQPLAVPPQAPTPPGTPLPLLDKPQKILLDALAFEPATVDKLIERTGLPSESVAAMLLILELGGLVQPHPGGRYSRSLAAAPN